MNLEAELPQRKLAQALSRGDLTAAAACFARDGCLITPDRTAIHGRERIRPVLGQLIASNIEIRIESGSTVAAGDALLARERWTIRTGLNDGRLEQVCEPVLVSQLIERRWKLAIAALWG